MLSYDAVYLSLVLYISVLIKQTSECIMRSRRGQVDCICKHLTNIGESGKDRKAKHMLAGCLCGTNEYGQ